VRLSSTFVLALVLALGGCSDPDDSGGDGGGGSHQGGSAGSGAGVSGSAGSGAGVSGSAGSGGASSGGSGGKGGTSSACNTFEANAPDYFYLHTTDAPPGGLGGTIVDGTYFVTSIDWYESPLTGTAPVHGGIRIDIAGTTWQESNGSPDDVAPPTHFTSTLAVDSPTVTMTQTCPTRGAPVTYDYTAEGETLTIFIVDPPYTFGMNLARQ
jgi:hypothetical protein